MDDGDVDRTTLEAFRNGDPDAIRVLYRAYARPVATVARSVVGADQSLIDDVVQLTFTKAWKAAATFEGDRRFSPWLYAIARRTAIDAVRAERRPTRGDHEPEVEIAVAPPSIERTWEAFEIRRAIGELPPEEQDVVKLGHLMGLTHPEIADRLGVPVGTVKSRSYRAHRRLAAALAHLKDDDTPNHPGTDDVRLSKELR